MLNEGFTEENKLVNSTMKVMRNKVIEKYQGSIDFLYDFQNTELAKENKVNAISNTGQMVVAD